MSLHPPLHSTSSPTMILQCILLTSIAAVAASAILVKLIARLHDKPVYLLDFACFKPPFGYRIPYAAAVEYARLLLNEKSAYFTERIFERSGIGEETGLPPCSHYLPPEPTLEGSHEEAELVIFTAIEEALCKTRIDVGDVNVLIVNCNSFFPMPSLTAKVVNRYKLREDVRSFNLSGMGCSCGPISVGLAKDLLKGHPDSVALIVSTEIITSPSW